MNNENIEKWSSNVIVADADYIDHVAFDLIVNFERMLGRRIPEADMARWLECVALDGGMREGEEQTSVVLVHDKTTVQLQNFKPSHLDNDLSGKAFKGPLGEFSITSVPVEDLTTKDQLFCDIVKLLLAQPEVKRLMLIANVDAPGTLDAIRHTLRQADDEKRITVFAMQPLAGGNFRQEILGYSLMQALGIRAQELG